VLGFLGIVGGVLQGICYVPYIRDIVRGSTRPHRGTWTIWCLLSAIVLASQYADGGHWSLLVAVAQVIGSAVIWAFSLTRGVGGTSRLDLTLGAVAALGVVGWSASGDPTIATVSIVIADTMAVSMMLPKTFRLPYSETPSAYAISAVSGLFAIAAVGSLDFGLLVYPVYVVAADVAVVAVIGFRRREIAPP
jgi:hypothetical protein